MTRFASNILKWYAQHARVLPWRARQDPYAVWISEVMLQQTRVETVLPYFERWLGRFPSIRLLAAASERSVLKQWEGLGYYARARSLRHAARIIVRDFNGQIPSEVGALRRLPGIGAYTAGAIASIAFGQDEPALDGNVRRVLARVFDVRAPAGSPASERRLRTLALENLPKGRAGDFNQALMDLGAVVCLPRSPACGSCPVGGLCQAKRLGQQAALPVRARRAPLRRVIMGAAVITRNGRVLLRQRPATGLLGGMWEFPKAELRGRSLGPAGIQKGLPAALRYALGLRVLQPEQLVQVRHAYSHFEVLVSAFRCSLVSHSIPAGLRWIGMLRLSGYPMGVVDRKIARSLKQDRP